MQQAGLGLNDGQSFGGANGEGFMRLNIGTQRAVLVQALGLTRSFIYALTVRCHQSTILSRFPTKSSWASILKTPLVCCGIGREKPILTLKLFIASLGIVALMALMMVWRSYVGISELSHNLTSATRRNLSAAVCQSFAGWSWPTASRLQAISIPLIAFRAYCNAALRQH